MAPIGTIGSHCRPVLRIDIKGFHVSTGLHKTQNIKQNKKKNKTNKTYYTEPGKCCICVFFFPPAAVFGGNMSAVAALMLARETQRIEAQGTHEGVVA